ncbi:MAG: hypothetical protein JWQ18_88 [Conexibacter sp.]|nr:hypothetical protein [Conexibacter sp.]
MSDSNDPTAQHVPGLRRPLYATRLLSGLIVASEAPLEPVEKVGGEPDLPGDLILAAPTAEDLGLGRPTLQDAIEFIQQVPFGGAIFLASVLAGDLYHHGRDTARQLRLAANIYPADVLHGIERFIADAPASHVVFDPRHVHALQRLLVVHAADDPVPLRDLVEREAVLVAGALMALATALPTADPPETSDQVPDWRGWTSFFTQAGGWYDSPYILEAVARAYTMYAEVASSDELQSHPARSEVDERLRTIYGLDLAEQFGAGLACVAISRAAEPDVEPGERPSLAPGFLGTGPFAELEERVVALISATREELRARVLDGGDGPEQIAWDHSALEARPFLRLPGGQMQLMSPRSLIAWMTRGAALPPARRSWPRPGRDGGTQGPRSVLDIRGRTRRALCASLGYARSALRVPGRRRTGPS